MLRNLYDFTGSDLHSAQGASTSHPASGGTAGASEAARKGRPVRCLHSQKSAQSSWRKSIRALLTIVRTQRAFV